MTHTPFISSVLRVFVEVHFLLWKMHTLNETGLAPTPKMGLTLPTIKMRLYWISTRKFLRFHSLGPLAHSISCRINSFCLIIPGIQFFQMQCLFWENAFLCKSFQNEVSNDLDISSYICTRIYLPRQHSGLVRRKFIRGVRCRSWTIRSHGGVRLSTNSCCICSQEPGWFQFLHLYT